MEGVVALAFLSRSWCAGSISTAWIFWSPKGLTQLEHIAWAVNQYHLLDQDMHLEPELISCLEFGIAHSAVDIDCFRQMLADRVQNKQGPC